MDKIMANMKEAAALWRSAGAEVKVKGYFVQLSLSPVIRLNTGFAPAT